MRLNHQYIERETGRIRSERLFGDDVVKYLYADQREQPRFLYRLLGSARLSAFLGWATYDCGIGKKLSGIQAFIEESAIKLNECVEDAGTLRTPRAIFERQIRYWQCRSMEESESAIVSPADSRIVIGSLMRDSWLFIKGKFFEREELFGPNRQEWAEAFAEGDFIICRLTPEKYHYNHSPVAGIVRDFYETDGQYHSCNPTAVIALATPYSKNKRTVTVIDTNVAGGTKIGLVAMFEIAALMIGEIVQCYSRQAYLDPMPIKSGMFLEKGKPKSLFRPGSSTTVLLFQKNRVQFSADLMQNVARTDIETRYSEGLGRPLVETDIKVRSTIGHRKGGDYDFE